MRSLTVAVALSLSVLAGCADADLPSTVSGATGGEGLADALSRWDAADAEGDAQAMHRTALTIPWDVARECRSTLSAEDAARLVEEGEDALARLDSEGGSDWDVEPDTIRAVMGSYLENVRTLCL